MRWLVDLFLLASLISLLSIPLALAREAHTPVTAKDPAQPVVRATGTPEPEKAMTQALDSYATGTSVDFLMESSPLSGEAVAEAAPSVMVPEPPTVSVTPVTLQVLQGTVLEKTDEVAMLVSEQGSTKDE